MELTGTQQEKLSQALLRAFSRVEILRRMVQFKLNRNLDAFTDGPLRDRVFQLIAESEREGWTQELIRGAVQDNPGNPLLKAFFQEYSASIQREAPGPELEKLVVDTSSFLDPARWRERLEAIERQVCQMEIGADRGTGFLIAPDVVLTNHHVVRKVIEGKASPDQVGLRFDYKRLEDGSELTGTMYELAQDWLLAFSPASPVDVLDPKPREATTAELDYALLHVKGQPGNERIDGNRTRGWVEVPAAGYDFKPGSPIIIVQHPRGDRLRLAIETNGILAVNAARTRVTYRTNTLEGSSGSPCFSQDWTLVALHHSGGPGALAKYNEGIPISTIRAHLLDSVRKQLGWT